MSDSRIKVHKGSALSKCTNESWVPLPLDGLAGAGLRLLSAAPPESLPVLRVMPTCAHALEWLAALEASSEAALAQVEAIEQEEASSPLVVSEEPPKRSKKRRRSRD